MVRSILPPRAAARHIESRLEQIEEREYLLLRGLVYEHLPDEDVAQRAGESRAAVLSGFVAALRQVAGLPVVDPDFDPRIARCLLSTGPVAERDEAVKRLLSDRSDPLELDALMLTLEGLRKLPAATWNRPVAPPSGQLATWTART